MKTFLSVFLPIVFLTSIAYSTDAIKGLYDFIAPSVVDAGNTDVTNLSDIGTILYDSTDDTFYGKKDDGTWLDLGYGYLDGFPGLSGNAGKYLRVNTGETDVEWSDSVITDGVLTPGSGANTPVIYSARVSAAGTVSNEIGDWIDSITVNNDGVPDYATVNFNTGAFASTPNCQAAADGYTGNQFGMTNNTSSSSVEVYIDTDAGQADNYDFIIICHGYK